mmetsp:Transcript_38406/g.81408  ORF Transcript_38406/g.81408 Transcript_38406/m.81408 type:complete len:215 (+) Transcript_38406:574-1218(+)
MALLGQSPRGGRPRDAFCCPIGGAAVLTSQHPHLPRRPHQGRKRMTLMAGAQTSRPFHPRRAASSICEHRLVLLCELVLARSVKVAAEDQVIYLRVGHGVRGEESDARASKAAVLEDGVQLLGGDCAGGAGHGGRSGAPRRRVGRLRLLLLLLLLLLLSLLLLLLLRPWRSSGGAALAALLAAILISPSSSDTRAGLGCLRSASAPDGVEDLSS